MNNKFERFKVEKGFTFIEMSVVLLILIILLGFTISTFGPFSRQKLNAAATLMMEDIRLTQKLCENQETSTYAIVFDRVNEVYYISRNTDIYKRVRLPAGIDLVGTNFKVNGLLVDNLSFNTKGRPSGVGGHVTLGDKKGNYLYVIVLSVTGRVRIDVSEPST